VDAEQVTLVDEAGVERKFVVHDAFEVDDRTYYLMEAADDPEEVLLLKEGQGTLESVDADEFDRVLDFLEAEE
jgi:hypothetical protein